MNNLPDFLPQQITPDFFKEQPVYGRQHQLMIVKNYLKKQFHQHAALLSDNDFPHGKKSAESTYVLNQLAHFIRPEDNSIRGFVERFVEDEDSLVAPGLLPPSALPAAMVPLLMCEQEVDSFFKRNKATCRLPVLTQPVGIDFTEQQIDSLETAYHESVYQEGTLFYVQESYRLLPGSTAQTVLCEYNDRSIHELAIEWLEESVRDDLFTSTESVRSAETMPPTLARFFGIIRGQEDPHLLGHSSEEDLYWEGLPPTERPYCCQNFCGFTPVDEQGLHSPICCQKPDYEPDFGAAYYNYFVNRYGQQMTNSFLMPLRIARIVFYGDGTRRTIEPIDPLPQYDEEPYSY